MGRGRVATGATVAALRGAVIFVVRPIEKRTWRTRRTLFCESIFLRRARAACEIDFAARSAISAIRARE
jgi:hypothetical protein